MAAELSLVDAVDAEGQYDKLQAQEGTHLIGSSSSSVKTHDESTHLLLKDDSVIYSSNDGPVSQFHACNHRYWMQWCRIDTEYSYAMHAHRNVRAVLKNAHRNIFVIIFNLSLKSMAYRCNVYVEVSLEPWSLTTPKTPCKSAHAQYESP